MRTFSRATCGIDAHTYGLLPSVYSMQFRSVCEALCSAVQVLYGVSKITGNMRAGIDVRYGIRSAIIFDHIPRKPHSSASCEACAWVAPGPFVRGVPAKRRRQVACIAS